MQLLTRDEFREAVFKRDNYKCIICGSFAQDAHHIMERRLFQDGGYYLDNGASLCGEHHIAAEQTILSVNTIRDILDIKRPILPENYYSDVEYDKWGNIILSNGSRLCGELFYDESVQKVLQPVIHLFTKYVKYPRTYHLPWSNGTDDDRFLKDDSIFEGKEVIATIKMDGENTTMYNDYIHARSIEYDSHRSRDLIKKFHASIAYNIPENMRICCENLTAVHSIKYSNLQHFCLGFSIWEKNKCLSWEDTLEWFDLLGIIPVPSFYRGIYDKERIEKGFTSWVKHGTNETEGYVIRLEESFTLNNFRTSIAKYVRPNHVSEKNHHWKFKPVEYNEFNKNF